MIKVPLRSLHRRIEKALLDHELESALNQSIQILKYYPKNLDTFRLLGKVMLEKQDYENAGKIFLQILAVDPDDFVANFGMSIVSESKGDLNQAIHFMERSFELQPGNDAIQNEIKRLIFSKDGISINKVKLTRGSLIHLYIQSDLVEQAIAEIKVGLHERPDRIEFKIALAKMLAKQGDHVNAVKTCIEIISKLPYCLQANLILYQVLRSEEYGKKATIYQHRLIELDPYYAFMTPETSTVQDVPDIVVLINDEPDTLDDAGSLDWDWMLKTIWEEESKWQQESAVEVVNWDSVIKEAIESNTNILATNSTEISYEPEHPIYLEKEETKRDVNDSLGDNKKSVFINKLRRSSLEISSNSDIPGWIFDENDSELSDQDTTADDSYKYMESINQQFAMDEQGMVDHDAPVETSFEEHFEQKANGWIKDNGLMELDELTNVDQVLGDTKQIHVGKVDDSELLMRCRKAIDGGNIRYALENIQELIDRHNHDDEIMHLLEEACHNHPDEIALWFKLGEVYLALDQKEKALDIFKKAERKISL